MFGWFVPRFKIEPGSRAGQVRIGMTEADVLSVMGKPRLSNALDYAPGHRMSYWHKSCFSVEFDIGGLVVFIGVSRPLKAVLHGQDLLSCSMEDLTAQFAGNITEEDETGFLCDTRGLGVWASDASARIDQICIARPGYWTKLPLATAPSWDLQPGVAIGPVRLGERMGVLNEQFGEPSATEPIRGADPDRVGYTHDWEAHGIGVQVDADGKVVDIMASPPAAVSWRGEAVFERALAVWRQELGEHVTEGDEACISCQELGVELSSEEAYDEADARVECVRVFSPGRAV